MAEKLRRLRVSTRKLRRYLIVWLVVIGGVFFGFWVVLDSLVFAVLASVLLLFVPWYLLRRMAERHRQKIEDQVGRRHGHAGQRGPGRAVAGPVDGDPGRPVPQADQRRVPPDRRRIQARQAPGADADRGQAAAQERELRPVRRRDAGQPRERRPAERNRRADRPVGAAKCSAWSGRSCRRRPRPASRPSTWPWPRRSSSWPTTSSTRGTPACCSPRLSARSCWRSAVVLNVVAYFWARVILNPDI